MNTVRFLLVASLFASANVANSQTVSEKESVILYNSQPIKVKLDGDKIKSIEGEAKGYMTGYNLTTNKPAGIASAERLTRTRSRNAPKDVEFVQTEVVKRDLEKNASYAVMQEQVMLNYRLGYATLESNMLDQLDRIIDDLLKNPQAKLSITAHRQSDTEEDKKLSENRIEAAKSYLNVKGISDDRITTDGVLGTTMVDMLALGIVY